MSSSLGLPSCWPMAQVCNVLSSSAPSAGFSLKAQTPPSRSLLGPAALGPLGAGPSSSSPGFQAHTQPLTLTPTSTNAVLTSGIDTSTLRTYADLSTMFDSKSAINFTKRLHYSHLNGPDPVLLHRTEGIQHRRCVFLLLDAVVL